MENRGWIKLHRKIMEGEDWLSEPFTRAQAWVDLLLLANHAPSSVRKRGIAFEVGAGQVGYGEEKLATRWRWSRQKVRRFLKELMERGAIDRKPVQQNPKLSSLITIINYQEYQSNGTSNETTNETMNKNDKNKKHIVEVVEYLNEKTGKKFTPSGADTMRHIGARLNEGRTVEQLKQVIDTKTAQWKGTEQDKYLRPSTLFGGKFEGYLNEKRASTNSPYLGGWPK